MPKSVYFFVVSPVVKVKKVLQLMNLI